MAKFSVHKNQQSSTSSVLFSMIPELIRSFDHISNDPESLDSIKMLRYRAYAGFHLMMIHSLLTNANAFEDAKTMLKRALSYEPDINFLNKVVIDACNYLNNKGLSNEFLVFTDIIIKTSLTIPNLHPARAVALCELERYEEAIESIRKEPMHAGLYGLLFRLQLHILLENKYVRDILSNGIFANRQTREIVYIINNLLTNESKDVYRILQTLSDISLASLENVINAFLVITHKEGTSEFTSKLKVLRATIMAIRGSRI